MHAILSREIIKTYKISRKKHKQLIIEQNSKQAIRCLRNAVVLNYYETKINEILSIITAHHLMITQKSKHTHTHVHKTAKAHSHTHTYKVNKKERKLYLVLESKIKTKQQKHITK